jgi:arginine deiminase
VSHTHGVGSGAGRLRTVLAHRPGPELRRIGPEAASRLCGHGLPWLPGAQAQHDALTQCLRDRGAEVLYVSELLQDVLEYPSARRDVIGSVLRDERLGDRLRADLRAHLAGLDPEELAHLLTVGLTAEEFRGGRGLVHTLLGRREFVIPPLPSLVFARDTSVWAGPAVLVASPAGAGRAREAALLRVIYRRHPRFAGAVHSYGPGRDWLDGGDVLQLAPGVVAVGVSERTTAAGAERLARHLLTTGLARAVLAVPLRHLPGARLGGVCTLVDASTVLMSPALAYTLQAHIVTLDGAAPGEAPLGGAPLGEAALKEAPLSGAVLDGTPLGGAALRGDGLRGGERGGDLPRHGELRVSRAQTFLQAAAAAMGTGALTVLRTPAGQAAVGQPDDSAGETFATTGDALAIGERVLVCSERNTGSNARLEAAGIEVIRVPGGELGTAGPGALACQVSRDPLRAENQAALSARQLQNPLTPAPVASAPVPVTPVPAGAVPELAQAR